MCNLSATNKMQDGGPAEQCHHSVPFRIGKQGSRRVQFLVLLYTKRRQLVRECCFRSSTLTLEARHFVRDKSGCNIFTSPKFLIYCSLFLSPKETVLASSVRLMTLASSLRSRNMSTRPKVTLSHMMFFKVVLQKLTPPQIRQLILYYHLY